MTNEDFNLMRAYQYCDNTSCSQYQVVGGGNLRVHSRGTCQLYCKECKGIFSVRRGTMFAHLRTPIEKVITCLQMLSEGSSMNAVSRIMDVETETLGKWILLAGEQVEAFSAYMQRNMSLTQVQIDEFWSYIRKKKQNLTAADIAAGEDDPEVAENQGDIWTHGAVVPDSGYIAAVHTSDRTLEEAEVFIRKIKARSDGKAPLFVSDCWFYMAALVAVYFILVTAEYCGRGRRPQPKKVADPDLQYAQIHKERDEKGKITKISTRIVLGDEVAILNKLLDAERCHSINTDYIESRNGKYRKDNARLTRRTLCHSKRASYHRASILFLTQIFNYTRCVEGLRVEINPDAPKFQNKYQHRTPAMAQGLIDKPLSIKELLFIRPLNRTP